jgi:nitrogen fixation-related uncharacterized protein
MSVIWILFVCSVIVLPATALMALRWAIRHGEFRNLPKTALSIFDEEEPVGRLSDHFPAPHSRASASQPCAADAPPAK